jgi:hypothetical protein
MAKKIQVFDELMEGFEQAIAQKKRKRKSPLTEDNAAHPIRLRVTETPRVGEKAALDISYVELHRNRRK